MTTTRPELALERILRALALELADAPEEEIDEVLRELGLTVGMRGSAALWDVRYPFFRQRMMAQSQHPAVKTQDPGDDCDMPGERPQTDRLETRDD